MKQLLFIGNDIFSMHVLKKMHLAQASILPFDINILCPFSQGCEKEALEFQHYLSMRKIKPFYNIKYST